MTEIQYAMARDYHPGVRGSVSKPVAKLCDSSRQAVLDIARHANGNVGDPVAPMTQKAQRLSSDGANTSERELDRNLDTTNIEPANQVGSKLTPRTVFREQARKSTILTVSKIDHRRKLTCRQCTQPYCLAPVCGWSLPDTSYNIQKGHQSYSPCVLWAIGTNWKSGSAMWKSPKLVHD